MRIIPLLLLAACAVDADPDTSVATSDLSVYQWTNDVQIPSQSAYGMPTLASHGGYLHMIHSGSSDATQLWWSRFNGTSWSQNIALPFRAGEDAGLASFGGNLTLVFKADRQNRLMLATSADGIDWSTPVTAGTPLGTSVLKSNVSVAVFGSRLYAGYCVDAGASDRVRIDRFDGNAWSTAASFSVTSDFHCGHVAIGVLGDTNQLDVVYTQTLDGFQSVIYEVVGTGVTNTTWTTPHQTTMASEKPMSIVYCDGDSHLVHGGQSSPSQIWWSYRSGSSWTTNEIVPNQTSNGGTGLGCYGGTRPIMVHNGGSNQLWWSEFTP